MFLRFLTFLKVAKRQKNTAKLDVKQRTLFVPMDFQPDDHKHEYKLAKVFGYVLQTEFN